MLNCLKKDEKFNFLICLRQLKTDGLFKDFRQNRQSTIFMPHRIKKLKDIRLFPDFAKITLDRHTEKIPELIEQRKKGKIAYLVMDKIVVKDRPPDFKRQNSDNEIFVNVGRERK